MCQILPFTLPCCRRIYVEVSKLPSCPDAWPEKKCPPELCIQVRGYEAEDRDAGICWRCQAQTAGIVGEQREYLRPEIDSAMIVQGLDEVSVTGRRRMVEEDGKCWYCGATSGCQHCGGAVIKVEAGAEQQEDREKKRRRDAGGKKGSAMNKRIKVEPRINNQPQSPAFLYPDPEHASQWPNVFPQSYNNMAFSPGYGLTQGSNMIGFGLPWAQPFLPPNVVPGTASVDWAAVYQENNNNIGQRYADTTTISGQQGEPFPADLLYQPYYMQDPSPAPDVKPRAQPEVRTRPPTVVNSHNKFQASFENPTQMDDARLAGLLEAHSNQNRNFGLQYTPPELQISAQNIAQEGDGGHQCTKVEQALPGT
jgi:hypothetical protein